MRIALLGGTGEIGEGLAKRWTHDADFEIVIGSREASRARQKAEEYASELEERRIHTNIEGYENSRAVENADIVVLAVPPYHVRDTVETVADNLAEGTILVSPAVGMTHDEDGASYNPPEEGSVTALAAAAAPDDVPVVGAFHNLPAGRLADIDALLGIDTVVVGDDPEARQTVLRAAAEIRGLQVIDAGPLANAPEVESVTPLLLNVAEYTESFTEVGIKFN